MTSSASTPTDTKRRCAECECDTTPPNDAAFCRDCGHAAAAHVAAQGWASPPEPPPPTAPAQPPHYPPPYAAPSQPPPPQYAPPYVTPVYVAPQRTNGFAIASLVLGIVWLYWLGSILALIFGYVAKSQIDSSGGTQGGRGMAIAGIVLGWVGVGVLVLLIVLGVSLA